MSKIQKALIHKDNWLVGKKVLITGATSGIGRALALLLHKNNSTVIAHGRTQESLKSLIRLTHMKDILTVVGDLRKIEGSENIESIIIEQQPDVMILNAGYNCRKELASHWTNAEIFDMIQVNLISPIMCARTFFRLPKIDKSRRLALILSTSCHFARAKMSLYIACKMGLMGFGRTVQQEARELGVSTTLFYPGRTNSNFRIVPNNDYMSPESVAQAVISVICLPDDIVPYEFTFRPEVDTFI